jgi:hypothetical protein
VAHRLDTAAFDREVRALLTAARWGAADVEQVLAATARIDLADADSWLREWTAAGGEAWAAARQGNPNGSYLCAASCYGAALALISAADGLVDEAALWARQRECWEHAVTTLGGERVEIAYEARTLPAFFVSGGAGRRPVIAVDPGGRMVTSEAWAHVGAAAHNRGFHWLVFDGPGRQAALRRQGLALRLDWEAVIGPVADALCRRSDVDPARMAIVGLEHGGFGVARALTVERRFAAAMVAPGIHDASRPWIDQLPDGVREALLDEDPDRFETELHLAALFAPGIGERLRRSGRCFGYEGEALYDVYRRITRYRLGDEVRHITSPTTICEPVDGGCWAGQATELAARVSPAGTLVRGRTADEAVLRWLDTIS